MVFSGTFITQRCCYAEQGLIEMSETQSARWVGLGLGGLLILLLALNAMSRTEASDGPEASGIVAAVQK
jgi:hypothetical protein